MTLTRAGPHRIIRCGVPEGDFAFSLFLSKKKRERIRLKKKERERIRSFDPARVKKVILADNYRATSAFLFSLPNPVPLAINIGIAITNSLFTLPKVQLAKFQHNKVAIKFRKKRNKMQLIAYTIKLINSWQEVFDHNPSNGSMGSYGGVRI